MFDRSWIVWASELVKPIRRLQRRVHVIMLILLRNFKCGDSRRTWQWNDAKKPGPFVKWMVSIEMERCQRMAKCGYCTDASIMTKFKSHMLEYLLHVCSLCFLGLSVDNRNSASLMAKRYGRGYQ